MMGVMEKSRFEKTGDTPWGPELKRIRNVPEDDKPQRPGRRGFLLGGAAAIATAGMPSRLGDGTRPEAANDDGSEPSAVESNESFEPDESFEHELAGYEAMARLRRNEVLFVDAENRPIGEPQPFAEYVDTKEGFDGEYLYTPGALNEVGIPEEGIAREWLDYVQARVQRAHPDREIADRYHVVGSFRSAYLEDDEPGLVAGIANGEIETYTDIVRYFSQKPVIGAEEYTREAYVSEAMRFVDYDPRTGEESPSEMSATVQAALRRITPGLCAQESKFNNDTESRVGARGIFQFMPTTWAEYGGEPEELLSLRTQVTIAGRHFASIYQRVLHHLGEDAVGVLRERFSSEEEFERDLLVPLMVNSYNAGSARVAEAARLYAAQTEAWSNGKGIFLDIAEFAEASDAGDYLDDYGEHAREYVTRIYAQANVLADE